MARVVVLGSSNTDMTVRVPRLPSPGETLLGGSFLTGPGGKGANQAIAARRAGAQVVFVTAVGDDDLGRRAIGRYREEGLDVSHILTVPDAPSGVALIFVSEAGENMIGVAPGANSRLDPGAIDRLPDSVFGAGDVLLAGLEVPLETVERAVRRAYRSGMRVILNPAPADPRLIDLDILRLVEVITPNLSEARILARTKLARGLTDPDPVFDGASPRWEATPDPLGAAQALLVMGATNVIVTLGDQGALLVETGPPQGLGRQIPPFRVDAVDTVGAGDAFNGALAAALAEGRPVFEAAAWASAAAALSVTKPGAQAALPHRESIDRLAATYPAK